MMNNEMNEEMFDHPGEPAFQPRIKYKTMTFETECVRNFNHGTCIIEFEVADNITDQELATVKADCLHHAMDLLTAANNAVQAIPDTTSRNQNNFQQQTQQQSKSAAYRTGNIGGNAGGNTQLFQINGFLYSHRLNNKTGMYYYSINDMNDVQRGAKRYYNDQELQAAGLQPVPVNRKISNPDNYNWTNEIQNG